LLGAVDKTLYSIGFAGLESVQAYTRAKSSSNITYSQAIDSRSCGIQIAKMVNKAGLEITASRASTQSVVRSRATSLLLDSTCPGFGMCAEFSDAGDGDTWPIVAVSVRPPPARRLYMPIP
jgi:hypothetical protein